MIFVSRTCVCPFDRAGRLHLKFRMCKILGVQQCQEGCAGNIVQHVGGAW